MAYYLVYYVQLLILCKYGSMHSREYLFCGVNFIIPASTYVSICVHPAEQTKQILSIK